MSLRHSYTLLAPIYDAIVGRGSQEMRRQSLAQLEPVDGKKVLLAGIGTGLDLPHLPPMSRGGHYVGVDLTRAMLVRARQYRRDDVHLCQGDVHALPCGDACFDAVVLHLILAVAPQPARTLREACRVLRPGGRILVFDKFLRPGQRAPLRRAFNLVIRHIATQTNVVFEQVLAQCPELQVVEDIPGLGGGWFRRIVLEKQG
ncbi:MAG TPA: class I SAM-dependent methyltransferase [Gammaproteobacteria bacterium]|nr:class I SAM-dependent methyltransferase [Gammaproteobacteria bacterium]